MGRTMLLGMALLLLGCAGENEGRATGGAGGAGGAAEPGTGGAGNGGSGGTAGETGDGGSEAPHAFTWVARETGLILRDVACDEAGTCLALVSSPWGEDVSLLDLDTGATWQWMEQRPLPPLLNLPRLAGAEGRFYVAGGHSGYFPMTLEFGGDGLLLGWEGTTHEACGGPCDLRSSFVGLALAGGHPSALLSDGDLLRRDHDGWSLVRIGDPGRFLDLAGTFAGGLLAATDQGIAWLAGDRWEHRVAVEGLAALWTDGAGLVAGVGEGVAVVGTHDSFDRWELQGELAAVWGRTREEIWAAGNGTIVRFDGERWAPEELPVPIAGRSFTGIAGTLAGRVIAVATDGLVLERVPVVP